MKRLMITLGVLACMAIGYVALKELFIYYGNRSLSAAGTLHSQTVDEKESSLQFIRTTHESLNAFLNFGKADSYTEGDWKNLKQWFQEQEPVLKEFPNMLQDTKLKNDTTRAYEALKLGVDKSNIQLVIYGHRIYHDLDILVNQYSLETNIWHYTEFEKQENVKIVEGAIQSASQ